MASTGVPATDCLPPELLEAILRFLDARTLCTARLVCAQFRDAASRCIHSVQFPVEYVLSQPEMTLNNFPNLSRVSVSGVEDDDLLMLAQSPVAAAVTHLRADESVREVPPLEQIAAGFPQQPLPNLTSLTVRYWHNGPSLFMPTLRELIIGAAVDSQTAELVAGLTKLTSLGIDVNEMRQPFEGVTALTALQRLEVSCNLSLIPYVAELTLLTHLHFLKLLTGGDELSDLAPLTSLARLRRLEHLGVRHSLRESASMEHQVVASVTTLSSLRSLHLRLFHQPAQSFFEKLCRTTFSGLTALALESNGLDASFLPSFNLERLRVLGLSHGMDVDRDAVSALGRATGLTELQLWVKKVGTSIGPEDWEIALSRMSRLRRLALGTPEGFQATSPLKAIPLLTELTTLVLRGQPLTTNAAGELCVGLKKLRVLSMQVPDCAMASSDPITPETFLAIVKLPELCTFHMVGNVGISDSDLPDDVQLQVNADRHAKGWLPLQIGVYDCIGSYPYSVLNA